MAKLKFPEDTKEIFSRELFDFLCWHENNREQHKPLVLSPIIDEYLKLKWETTLLKQLIKERYTNDYIKT